MNSTERSRTTVYVVEWPDLRILKVGRTILPSRVYRHVRHGAVVIRLFRDASEELERRLLRELSRIGLRAFDTWRAAVPLLGAGGIGFSECYELNRPQRAEFMEVMDRAHP